LGIGEKKNGAEYKKCKQHE